MDAKSKLIRGNPAKALRKEGVKLIAIPTNNKRTKVATYRP